jgi:hypothetical protein
VLTGRCFAPLNQAVYGFVGQGSAIMAGCVSRVARYPGSHLGLSPRSAGRHHRAAGRVARASSLPRPMTSKKVAMVQYIEAMSPRPSSKGRTWWGTARQQFVSAELLVGAARQPGANHVSAMSISDGSPDLAGKRQGVVSEYYRTLYLCKA